MIQIFIVLAKAFLALAIIAIPVTIVFFAAQTLQFLGRGLVGLLLDKSISYFSTVSVVISSAFAIYTLFRMVLWTKKEMRLNARLAATRIVKEGCDISKRIINAMTENGIPGGKHLHLIQAATLEAIFGGSNTILAGMTRDILRNGVRVYREQSGDDFARYFLDCHDAVQYVYKGSATPEGIIESSLIWLCGILDESCGTELSEQQKCKLMSIFRSELSEAIKRSPAWISHPEKDFVN